MPTPTPSSASLVRAIHAAGADVDLWPQVLDQLRQQLDARVVTLGHHGFATGSDAILFESSDSGTFSRELEPYSARNPWFLSSEDYTPGRVMTGEELIGPSELRRTDFYRHFLQPRGLLHLLCGVVDQRHQGTHCVSIYRAEDQAAFSTQQRAMLARLLDHITLSLRSQWRWQEADELSQALLTMADQDSRPLLLVNGLGESQHRNRAADRLLDEQMGLCLEGPRVVSASPADRRLLQETFGRLAQPGVSAADAAPAVLTLACPPPMPPVVVVVRALGQMFTRHSGVRQPLVMLAVRGGPATHDASNCRFAHQYELTTAQAKVSELVFAGQSLSAIAHSLSLSENTVRSHLKQIFQKTETHGQMELVHLHARMCSALP